MHSAILGGGGLVAAGTGQAMGAVPPEAGERGGVAEVVGDEGQHGLDAVRPEFLRALHPPVDLFDGRFHVGARDRQSLLAVFGIIHPRLLVPQVSQRLGDDRGGGCLGSLLGGFAQLLLSEFQCGDDAIDLSAPDPLRPLPDTLANLLSKPDRPWLRRRHTSARE